MATENSLASFLCFTGYETQAPNACKTGTMPLTLQTTISDRQKDRHTNLSKASRLSGGRIHTQFCLKPSLLALQSSLMAEVTKYEQLRD